MRFGNFIELYKTPLDPDYRNVYDDYNTYTTYITFLREFDNKRIYVRDSEGHWRLKSVKDKNGEFTIVIPGYDSMDLHEYNYILFYTEAGKPLFAFILSVNSLNDGDSSKSCQLECRMDAWTHNYFDMKKGYDVNQIECRHMIESVKDGADLKVIPYITDEGNTIVECYNSVTTPKLLWARVTCGNEVKCAVNVADTENALGCGVYPLSTTTPVFYIPMFVCVPLTGEIKFEYKYAYSSDNLLIREMTDGKAVIGLFASGTELISIELTYYCPYVYSLDADNNKVTITATHDYPEKNGNLFKLFDKSNNPLFTNGWFNNTITAPFALGKLTNYANKHYDNISCFLSRYYPNSLPSPNSDGYYETLLGRLKNYPYNYSSVTFNGKEVNAIPEIDRKEMHVYIDFQDSVKPVVKIYQIHNDNSTEKVQFEVLDSFGEVTTTEDSYESFKRNNGNKLLVGTLIGLVGSRKTMPNMVNTIGRFSDGTTTMLDAQYQVGEKVVPSPIGIAGTVGMSLATMADADNKFDNYKTSQIDAYSNPFLQDYIGRKDYKYIDCMSTRLLMRKLHDFGLNINQRLSVREKTHWTFDYVKTSNCSLPMIGNIDDRTEIEQAYNRGITKWHLSGNSYDSYMKTFNKNIPNMDLIQHEFYSVG